MKKIIIILFSIIAIVSPKNSIGEKNVPVSPSLERSDMGDSCSKLYLKHDGGFDGQDIQGNPRTRFHVVGSSGESGCPPKNSIVDVRAHFYGDIEGTLNGYLIPASPYELQTNTVLIIKIPLGEAQEVKVVSIIPCSGKGHVGSGTPGLCREGLLARSVFDPKTCDPLLGGYICLNCGDNLCEKGLEDYCNCPEDCSK